MDDRTKALIAEDMPVIVAFHDLNHTLRWANAAYRKATGLSLEQIEGRKCWDVWGLSGICRGCPAVTAIETGQSAEAELTSQNQDHWPDSQGTWLSRATPMRGPGGETIGVIETAIDITKLETTAQLNERKARAFLDRVVDHLPIAMWVASREGTVIRTNRSLRRILGLGDAQIVGKYNVLDDKNLEKQGVMPLVRSVFENLKPVRFTLYWRANLAGAEFPEAAGLQIDVSMFPIVDNDGRIEHVVCQWVDITARVEAEAKLRTVNQQIESSNRQLRAAEQQLGASNQQLQAAIQQLRATEQQLRASNHQLRVSEQRLQKMVTALEQEERLAKTGFFERNWQTDEAMWSRGFWELLGLEPNESAPGHEEFMRFVHEDDVERVNEYVESTLRRRNPGNVHFRLVRRDGEIVEIRGVTESHYLEDGRPLFTCGTFQDITHQNRTERALRPFQWLLEKDLLGSDHNAEPYVPPYDDVTALNRSRLILNAVGSDSLKAMARDLMDLLDTSVAVYERNGDYACGVFDSTWCRMLDSASFTRCQIKDTAQALHCGAWLCHENCWNDSAKTAIDSGAPTDIECVGGIRIYAVPIYAGNRIVGAINMGYGTPPTESGELRAMAERFDVPFEEIRRAALSYKPRPQFIIDVAKRRCRSIARAIGDAVEKAEMKVQLAQSDRLSSMGTLAAGVAHEINNPLAYTLYNLEKVVEDLPRFFHDYRRLLAASTFGSGSDESTGIVPNRAEFDEFVDYARKALEGAERIRSITRTLGTFSRVDDTELGPVDLKHVAEHARNLAQNEIKYRARLVLDLPPVPAVLGSEGKLSQVFLNLLTNAAHAIDEGDEQNNCIRIRTYADGDYVVAEVSDTGTGIPEEHMNRLFDPFFTTKPVGVGSGLGLSISKKIVTELGGDINCESEVGRGTTFHIRLPLMPHDWGERRAVETIEKRTVPKARGRILVVDDEAGIRGLINSMLKRDHEVLTAASGAEGKEILAADQSFDLIILDLMMPQISGMDLHCWIADTYPRLADRVIFITGGVFTPRARDYLSKVNNMRIEKPFKTAMFRKLVAEFIADRSMI